MEELEKKELVSIKAEVYQAPIADYLPQIKKGTDILNGVQKVTDTVTLEAATINLNRAKTLNQLIAKKVEEICRPLKDIKKDIDEVQRQIKAYSEEIQKPLVQAQKLLEDKILKYHRDLKAEADRIRKINEDMIREQEEKRRKEEEEAKANGTPPPPPSMPVAIETKPVVEPPSIKGLTTIWKYEITDPKQLPREFLIPDLGKINTAVKSGTREIPGVRIYQDELIKKV